MHEGGKKAILAALLANAGITLAKFVGFLVTGASSMLAESIHSLADTGNQGLLFLGGAKANRAPDDQHPFGYGRERYFWAFVVSMVLFSIGSVFAIFEGIHKWGGHHELEMPEVAIVILLVAVALEGLSFRTAITEAKKMKGSEGWWRFIRQTKQPEITVVLLEDTAALIGLFFALAGVSLTLITGNTNWDAAGTFAIGILLGIVAVILATENKSLLIGESASPQEAAAIIDAITADSATTRTIHLRTLHLGPDDLLVTAKVEFNPELSQAQVAESIDAIEVRIRDSVPTARLIFIEPDVYRPEQAATSPPPPLH